MYCIKPYTLELLYVLRILCHTYFKKTITKNNSKYMSKKGYYKRQNRPCNRN